MHQSDTVHRIRRLRVVLHARACYGASSRQRTFATNQPQPLLMETALLEEEVDRRSRPP